MNRVGLWFGVIGLFVIVTVASFCIGKYVLGDRLLNRPQIQVQHLPYESRDDGSATPQFAKDRPFSDGQSRKRDHKPRVVIEVQPPTTYGAETEDPNDASEPKENDTYAKHEHQSVARSHRENSDAAEPIRENRTRETIDQQRIDASPQSNRTPPSPHDRRNDKARSDDLLRASAPPIAQAPPKSQRSQTPAENATVRPVVADRGKPKVPAPAADRRHRVQVGLFAVKENADALISELQQQGFHANTSSETQEGTTFYRVQLGPFKDKESAAKVKQHLSELGFPGSFVPQSQ